jgi:hypothetical protein
MATRRYMIRDTDVNIVLLEIDHAMLTPELAAEINDFWSGASERLSDQAGDVVQTVIRLFGANAIVHMQREGGVDFSEGSADRSEAWTRDVVAAQVEGWPEVEHLGIRIVEAYVTAPDYFGVTLEALP